ncbi:hypothetical protein Q1695_001516 [Nippostrongylus brasiliensis]|nr:hypothetical protein Q1695_001516 [Nippostrongylus brasiliensis]
MWVITAVLTTLLLYHATLSDARAGVKSSETNATTESIDAQNMIWFMDLPVLPINFFSGLLYGRPLGVKLGNGTHGEA